MTCIDNGMPVVMLRTYDIGISGYEKPAELAADIDLKSKLEVNRVAVGLRMMLENDSRCWRVLVLVWYRRYI